MQHLQSHLTQISNDKSNNGISVLTVVMPVVYFKRHGKSVLLFPLKIGPVS